MSSALLIAQFIVMAALITFAWCSWSKDIFSVRRRISNLESRIVTLGFEISDLRSRLDRLEKDLMALRCRTPLFPDSSRQQSGIETRESGR